MSPKVTVYIPTYNRAHFLGDAIISVLSQTFGDFELLISDNASTDGTREVVASLKDPRIRYHRHPANIGMVRNWQAASQMVTTEWGAPLSDDDVYESDHLETAFKALTMFPDAVYYACTAARFGGTGGELRPLAITDRDTPFMLIPPKEAHRFLGSDNPGPMMTMVCRRRALQSDIFWGTSELLPQDVLVMTQLMAQGGFVFGNRPTVRYRIHDANVSYRSKDIRYTWRFNVMLWYVIRYVAQFLVKRGLCTWDDIETHSRTSPFQQHVVPTVLALSSFHGSSAQRAVARRIFQARQDMDAVSARFRLARRAGFWSIPVSEQITHWYCGWRPPKL